MTFEQLELAEPILRALKKENYSRPTDIQAQAIPHVLNRRDVMGSAQTGTGKTAAFAIPILQHLERDRRYGGKRGVVNALIVTPTRELAIQIGESLTAYGHYTGIRNTVIFGGVKQGKQVEALRRGVDILVATPGRLLDLMDQGIISLSKVEYFVLDEADRMLDMGFIHDIRKIIARLPAERQSLFFSATMPDDIVSLSRKILSDPVKVAVSPVSSTAETIRQYLYYTNKSDKNDLLLHILKDPDMDQVLLFARTKHGADRIVKNLGKKKISAAAIHGNKSQNQRQKALGQFKDGKVRVLVATDIAARGIDIDQLRYVVNFDIPNVAETYVHRIGRSGRAGEEGVSISLCEPEENAYIRDIEKLIDLKIERVEDHPFPQTERPMTAAEKQEFEKEKQRRKQEYFASRKRGGGGQGRQNRGRRR
ncbi:MULTISPECIES: DEAD/DEAH box helicase [Robiginitalea]|uniref:DEAD-box ATP-dependent RNA helicase RhpA n=1 Tax=Robiginitalea biformata (strain ATCC BAA-864 / DSM 15991 / KCTC 12146 / HTCC2501) TaxID=313596 RepID=A4CNQ5_ROBBH|nr:MULTISPECIES: DEAD/DEAH box helicase [Robiginitalea]EAR14522.1 DEAD/DEAH box helicase-like protein [Robiginitalea biformata HTCC2501]MDC6375260.1 DEAD/DEAH box helicase [Robiginitalea sp. SP8]